jgi:hypothetical protein
VIRLRGFLDLLATHGGGEIRAADLAEALAADGGEVRSALRAQGVVRSAPRASTVPCDGLGCAREVRERRATRGDADRRRLLAVCTREPAECETIAVDERDVAQELVSRDAFVAAVQRALKITPAAGALGAPAERCGAQWIGEEIADGEPRDVLLAWDSYAPALWAAVASRAPKEVRVLLVAPTGSDPVPAAPRPAGVVVDRLVDLLTVREGQIAELPRLRVVAGPTVAAPPPEPPADDESPARRERVAALAGMREATRWGEITLFAVDEEDLVGVAIDERHRKLSCIDFGLASVDGRKPLVAFRLLKTICEGNGMFVTRAFGSRANGKRLVSDLRKALRATFGIEGDPFEAYSFRDHQWKTRFRALAAPPKVMAAARRGLLGD